MLCLTQASLFNRQSEAERGPEEGSRTKEGDLDTGSHDTHLREQRCSALFTHLKDYYLNVYCVQLHKESRVCQIEISREESKMFYSDGGVIFML